MDDTKKLTTTKTNRRQFLKTLSGLAALSASGMSTEALLASAGQSYLGSDIVTLGDSGVQVSRLAQGTGTSGGRQQSDFTRMGKKAFDYLLSHSLDHGINLLDMADLYGTHSFVKDHIKRVSREKTVLLTKIWPREENWNTPSGGAIAEVDRFRKELDVDKIDIVLIHCMTNDKWPEQHKRIRDELSELKEKKIVRAAGVSCHNFGALKIAASDPWTDVIMARINHKGGRKFQCDASVEEVTGVLKTAKKNGKGIVGMKIFGAGSLVNPEQKDASLNYVLKNDLIDTMTIGMQSTQQIDDVLKRMAKIS